MSRKEGHITLTRHRHCALKYNLNPRQQNTVAAKVQIISGGKSEIYDNLSNKINKVEYRWRAQLSEMPNIYDISEATYAANYSH